MTETEATRGGYAAEDNRLLKERLVSEGRAHAAMVVDGDTAVAWCQYGSPEELANIYHRKEYQAGLDQPPDYRLTCFFVDKKYRRKGVAGIALQGALHLIAQAGGGTWGRIRRGPGGPEGVGILPLQRHPQSFRTGRLQLRPAQG